MVYAYRDVHTTAFSVTDDQKHGPNKNSNQVKVAHTFNSRTEDVGALWFQGQIAVQSKL